VLAVHPRSGLLCAGDNRVYFFGGQLLAALELAVGAVIKQLFDGGIHVESSEGVLGDCRTKFEVG
jgi:hypothetical protein